MALSKEQLPDMPLRKAVKVKKSIIPMESLLQPSDHIAAIDFGTSSVSLAYKIPLHKDEVQVLKLHTRYERVPNAVMFQRNEDTGIHLLQKIGQRAQSGYSELRARLLPKYIYFERIKIMLANDETISHDTKVTAFTGGEYYLLEVIAFIITHLKETLLAQLNRDQNFKASDFDWVITVPAIWKARARRMMREAAYLAGLTCDKKGITKFTDTSRGTLPRPLEVNPHKLTLALEPEAAAIYAHKYSHGRPPPRYMVVDIGGGTVDITVHETNDNGKIDVIIPPTGNTWGGTTVNQAFQNMIEDLVQDKGHQHFLATSPTAKPTLNKLYFEEFEEQKKTFGEQNLTDASKEITINLPSEFVEFYKKNNIETRAQEKEMEFDNNKLYIRYNMLESEIFRQSINNIISCVKSVLDQLKNKVNTIYLVGGFGGCTFMGNKIKEALASQRGIKYDHIICPQQADLAVTKGAVMWRQAPDIIQSRIADATYGIDVSVKFNPSIHDDHYWYKDEEGKERCRGVFEVFVQKGEEIGNEVYKTSLIPETDEQTTMTLDIFCTTDTSIQYTIDKKGKLTVQKIGNLIIDIPNQDKKPRNKRLVDIYMDFRGTEIQASAKYRITEKEVKTVCDFLTLQDISNQCMVSAD